MRVERLMHAGDADAARRARHASMRDVIYEMSRKGLGMTCVVDADGTPGRHHHRRRPAAPHERARRARAHGRRRHDAAARDRSARTVLAVEALKILEERKISSLIVVDDDRRPLGVLHLHDLWRTEMF